MRAQLLVLSLLCLIPAAAAHEGTGSHEAISGRIEPGSAWSWTVDEPEGLSYYVDTSAGRQGALRIGADDDAKQATHTVRIVAGEGGLVRLEPQDLTVEMGDKVTWVNDDAAAHTIVGSTGFYREPEAQPGKGVPGVGLAAALLALACAAVAGRARRPWSPP